jgi:DNA-binding response OmpR family regulator
MGVPSLRPQDELKQERPARVLVVDDNRDVADSLAVFLRLQGYQVDIAYDGPAALKQAELFPPDAVALDIGLPGMDGYEVARRLRKLRGLGSVLIVAVTGYGRPQDVQMSMEAGINHHLVKPLNPEVLITLIEAYAARTGSN